MGPDSYPTYRDAEARLSTWGTGYRFGGAVQARSEAQRREFQAAMAESNQRLRQGLDAQAARDDRRLSSEYYRLRHRQIWWQQNKDWVALTTILVVLAVIAVLALHLL